MKLLYFDCPAGISGDMCLGALVDMGVSIDLLRNGLKKLRAGKITLSVKKEKRHGITGTRLVVTAEESRNHRTFSDIKGLIEKSSLHRDVKDLSIAIFKNLAKAEGKIHGIAPSKVHFHEVGAIDSIADIVGTAIAIKSLEADKVFSSALPTGGGWVATSHGRMPVPAPATVELLKGVPTAPSPAASELTTPTGAAIIKTLADGFGTIPPMKIEKTGYGIGGRDFKDIPNLLRLISGESMDEPIGQSLFMLETNIDDMNPQIAGYLVEKLLSNGALDAYITPVFMKKTRPGILLTVLTDEKKRTLLMDMIFSESTSIGIRSFPVERLCLERKFVRVKTPYGGVRVKVSLKDGFVVNAQPEYEECRVIAEKKKVPLKRVMDAARAMVK